MERINQIAKGMVVTMIVVFCSCTKYNYIDGGIANEYMIAPRGIFSHG
ncbi:MAG: hypothetical protein ACLU4J_03395 [Butyricimonas paravirosa]